MLEYKVNEISSKNFYICFKLYVVQKGCEITQENKIIIKNELSNEEIKDLIYNLFKTIFLSYIRIFFMVYLR